MKIPCTVGILTFNNEKTLGKALDSVKDFSEIIICDGGSTDKTIEIAQKYGCKIISQDAKYKYHDNRIADFSGVRNQMLDAASNDWFFYLDSDEFISDELSKEMMSIIDDINNRIFVYNVPRKYVLAGQIINHASTYPNYQMRFFNKKHVKGFIKKVHERIDVLPNEQKGKLKECIFVPHENDVGKLRGKYDYYLKIQLEKLNRISLRFWLRWIFVFELRSLLASVFKYFKNLLLLRSKRLPFKIELIKWESSFKLMLRSLKLVRSF